ncbi:MAG TPA: hypothetical protein VJB82_01015 [Candidatus Peribacterales bacterium]|nr:hypothetical protein [Candidatus Peribacterales bacterium]
MFKGLIAIIASFFLIKYRERVVATTGKFDWCEKYLGMGGTYRFMVILAVFLFLWGVASITGTTDVLLSPLRGLFSPGGLAPSSDF